MMSDRTPLHLDQLSEAARLATSYIDGMDQSAFLADSRTQQAVAMNLVIIGEAVSRIIQDDPDFVTRHPELPWRQMTGMRNRFAHGYFDLNMRVVWETARSFVPELLKQIPAIRAAESARSAGPAQL